MAVDPQKGFPESNDRTPG